MALQEKHSIGIRHCTSFLQDLHLWLAEVLIYPAMNNALRIVTRSYTIGQSFFPDRYPIYWASSQRSHIVSSMPCHGVWASAPLSSHLFTRWEYARHLRWRHPFAPTTQQVFSSFDNECNRSGALGGRSQMACWVDGGHSKTPYFHPWHCTHHPGMALPRTVWVPLNRLCIGVGWFYSCLYKWGMAASSACNAVQKHKPSTMMSFNVHSTDHPTDWWFWMIKQLNGCSTPAPRWWDLLWPSSGLKELAQMIKWHTWKKTYLWNWVLEAKFIGHRLNYFCNYKKVTSIQSIVWKSSLVNTAMASFNTIMG